MWRLKSVFIIRESGGDWLYLFIYFEGRDGKNSRKHKQQDYMVFVLNETKSSSYKYVKNFL